VSKKVGAAERTQAAQEKQQQGLDFFKKTFNFLRKRDSDEGDSDPAMQGMVIDDGGIGDGKEKYMPIEDGAQQQLERQRAPAVARF